MAKANTSNAKETKAKIKEVAKKEDKKVEEKVEDIVDAVVEESAKDEEVTAEESSKSEENMDAALETAAELAEEPVKSPENEEKVEEAKDITATEEKVQTEPDRNPVPKVAPAKEGVKITITGRVALYKNSVVSTPERYIDGVVYDWGKSHNERIAVTLFEDGIGVVDKVLGWIDIR